MSWRLESHNWKEGHNFDPKQYWSALGVSWLIVHMVQPACQTSDCNPAHHWIMSIFPSTSQHLQQPPYAATQQCTLVDVDSTIHAAVPSAEHADILAAPVETLEAHGIRPAAVRGERRTGLQKPSRQKVAAGASPIATAMSPSSHGSSSERRPGLHHHLPALAADGG